MSKRNLWMWMLTGALTAAACGGDDGAGSGGSGGTGTGGAGTGAGTSGAGGTGGGDDIAGYNRGEINLDCPGVPPLEGRGAPRGECCHRASNLERETVLGPDEDAALEYRIQYTLTTNHPLTIGEMTVMGSAITRSDNEEQSVLWSFGGMREDGKEISGPGYTKIGNGRYNCDGTYSYFSETAAPARGIPGRDDPARWAPRTIPATIDADATGRDHSVVAWKDQRGNREIAYVPFLGMGTFVLEFELATQGFDIDSIETEGEGRDCIGKREGAEWKAGGQFHIFTPLEPNSHEGITLLSGEKYCELVAFGIAAPPLPDCVTGDRCEPGTTDCPWKKLPDSLCPETETEMDSWSCHVGYVDNPDGDPTNCTQEAPTGVLDPDLGATSEGQCCDPLAKSTTLPACNSYLLKQEYVAAAAEITEELSDDLPVKCE